MYGFSLNYVACQRRQQTPRLGYLRFARCSIVLLLENAAEHLRKSKAFDCGSHDWGTFASLGAPLCSRLKMPKPSAAGGGGVFCFPSTYKSELLPCPGNKKPTPDRSGFWRFK